MSKHGWMAAGLFVAALSGCGLTPEKVSEADVSAAQKASAQALATRLYEACRMGRFDELGDEAIPAMREGLSPDKQRAACTSITAQFGAYSSMEYAETWKQRGLYIYRFKGHFTKSESTPEIRVVMDKDDKLSGFWLKPWSDTLM